MNQPGAPMKQPISANGHEVSTERPSLTRRERQVLSLLAEGSSGAQIAAELVLSPETVRTHVRNAMAKLGATTRSQAVVIALQRDEIDSAAAGGGTGPRARPLPASAETRSALEQMLGGLASLYDVDAGAVYLSEADGLSLRQVATTGDSGFDLPEVVALGDGTLGRVALERRSQLLHDDRGSSRGALIVAPILAGGRLVGVIAFAARVSRPVGRSELLLLQAFSNRVGEVIAGGGDVERQLGVAMDRFRTSWSAAATGIA